VKPIKDASAIVTEKIEKLKVEEQLEKLTSNQELVDHIKEHEVFYVTLGVVILLSIGQAIIF
jgi:hypothetical protein